MDLAEAEIHAVAARNIRARGCDSLRLIARTARLTGHAVDVDRKNIVGRFRIHDRGDRMRRSEEHTSELQSLMRISYAVFCLKKKTSKENTTTTTDYQTVTIYTRITTIQPHLTKVHSLPIIRHH